MDFSIIKELGSVQATGKKRFERKLDFYTKSELFGFYAWTVFVKPSCTRIIGCIHCAGTSLGDSEFVKGLNKMPESRDCS